jgi:hypothetical protein
MQYSAKSEHTQPSQKKIKQKFSCKSVSIVMKKLSDNPSNGAPKTTVHISILRNSEVDVGIPPGKTVASDTFTDVIFGREISSKSIIL